MQAATLDNRHNLLLGYSASIQVCIRGGANSIRVIRIVSFVRFGGVHLLISMTVSETRNLLTAALRFLYGFAGDRIYI
ncbi:MAG: hypothetical protein BWY75_02028 [bacterium ADurb.Bin425]|nr:MAG: hypothetical protein BWY75_02028 [bacterium ADurb.Bin425]